VTLQKWGMIRDGVLSERITSAHLTSGTGFGSLQSWPTPAARDYQPTNNQKTLGLGKFNGQLPNRVKMHENNWPTPRAREWKDTGDLKKLSKLIDNGHEETRARSVAKNEVAMWPTPTAAEADKIPATDSYGQIGLNNNPAIRGLPKRDKLEKGKSGARREGNPQLNPSWVEWLMGWPIGWTRMEKITELDWRDWSVDPASELQPRGTNTEGLIPTPSASETGLRNKNYAQGGQSIGVAIRKLGVGAGSVPRVTAGTKNRVGRLKAIGNGQCPQAAALAWTILSKAE